MSSLTCAFLGRPLGKTSWLHASSVSECVKLLVYTFCIVHIFLMQRRIRFVCGVLMPYNVGNIMRVGMLGSKVINPNSLAPFFVSSLSPRKGRGQKMGVPPGFRTRDPPHHNALFTHGTPPGCRCPGSDFVPI